MHILLFYQYYHNRDCAATGRHFQFVQSLSERHQVTVITSDVWERKRQTRCYSWAPEGVRIISHRAPYENAMQARSRLKAYAGYAGKAFLSGMRLPRPDVIIGSSTPLSAAWAAARVAQIRRIPWIFEVRDLWPDFPIQMGAIPNRWLQQRLYRMESRLYRSAAHIVPLSPDMEDHVLRQGISPARVTTLLNGTDLDLAASGAEQETQKLRAAFGWAHKSIVLYAGTFGRANAIPFLIESARRLAHRSDVHFVFLGEGYYADQLRAASGALPNISFLPPEPRHRIFRWFRLADLAVVSFLDLPVLAANSPAKFFDSLACGTPVIVTNPGWTKSFVETHRCGWYASPNEPDSLVRCIEEALANPEGLEQAGRRGRDLAIRLFDRNQMAGVLERIALQCASSSGTNA